MADWENGPIPEDERFEIGTKIKGKLFSECLSDKGFLTWVNDLLNRDYADAHPQFKRFHKFARIHGAYK